MHNKLKYIIQYDGDDDDIPQTELALRGPGGEKKRYL